MHLSRHLLSCPRKLVAQREASLHPVPIVANVAPEAPIVIASDAQSPEAESRSPEAPLAVPDEIMSDCQDAPTMTQDPEFDFSFELCKFFTLCNQGRGLPDKDIQGFIDMYNIARAKSPNGHEGIEFETLGQFKKYRHGFVLNDEGGIKTVMIDITDEDVPGLAAPLQFPFAVKDILIWMGEEFRRADYREEVEGSNPKQYKSSLCMEAAPEYKMMADGSKQRIITTPQTADTWIQLQAKLRSQAMFKDSSIAAVQLYSDKTLVNHKGMSCHPVKAALFNVPYSKRIKGILSDVSTVAYFQDLNDLPDNITVADKRLVKLAYMSKALDVLLGPLKQASYEGLRVKDPVGSWMDVHPRILSYVMDLPESKDVFMVKGFPAKHPCEACMVHKDDLHDIFKGGVESRTVERQKQAYEELMLETHKASRTKLATALSTQPVPCALFGFADQEDDDECSVMHVLAHESLHNEDIGVFLYLIDYLEKYFDNMNWLPRKKNLAYQKMNKRLESMPRAGTIKLHII